MTETMPLFLSQLSAKGKQPKTISTYESVLRQFALDGRNNRCNSY
jgi:hypothetical protein